MPLKPVLGQQCPLAPGAALTFMLRYEHGECANEFSHPLTLTFACEDIKISSPSPKTEESQHRLIAYTWEGTSEPPQNVSLEPLVMTELVSGDDEKPIFSAVAVLHYKRMGKGAYNRANSDDDNKQRVRIVLERVEKMKGVAQSITSELGRCDFVVDDVINGKYFDGLWRAHVAPFTLSIEGRTLELSKSSKCIIGVEAVPSCDETWQLELAQFAMAKSSSEFLKNTPGDKMILNIPSGCAQWRHVGAAWKAIGGDMESWRQLGNVWNVADANHAETIWHMLVPVPHFIGRKQLLKWMGKIDDTVNDYNVHLDSFEGIRFDEVSNASKSSKIATTKIVYIDKEMFDDSIDDSVNRLQVGDLFFKFF